MDEAIIAAAETLVTEFPDEPTSTVIRILTDCADEFPDADPLFVEQAVRARLRLVQTARLQVPRLLDDIPLGGMLEV